jgi:hypothetical protein
MLTSIISRRRAAQMVAGALSGGGMMLLVGQDYRNTRDIVAKVQGDLERAADFTRNKEKERDRYHDVQRKLSDFDRELTRGKFDKGKLDQAIDDLKDVVNNNTLESHDRDTLREDLAILRTVRAVR